MKKLITEQVLNLQDGRNPILYKQVRETGFVFEDGDYIRAGYSEPYVEGDSASDGFFFFSVEREREETDEEYNKRLKREERDKKWAKERRYESFLKLKKEFEPDDSEKFDK
jgi:hypothetical protein